MDEAHARFIVVPPAFDAARTVGTTPFLQPPGI